MDNLFDILRTAQDGHAIDNLARQFELSRRQAEAAVEALLPAFSLGMKRQVERARREAPPPTFFGLAGLPPVRELVRHGLPQSLDQYVARPPDRSNTEAVVKEFSLLTSQLTMFAASSTSRNRPRGMRLSM